ncbi:MAG: hypothetical protein ACFFFH_09960, partial [Candidatus Thorarchaeota archaeon]
GSRICLKAITTEDQLRTIEIQSEGFNLKLEDTEARDFLNILNQIAASAQYSPDKIVQKRVPDVSEEIKPEIKTPIEEPLIAEIAPPMEEPIVPEVPDSSEIIQVLKESERTYSEITPSSPDDTSIVVSKKAEEPSIHEVEKEIIKEPLNDDEPFPAQETPDVISSEIETASFFQQSVSKSPLEMLLEEDKGKKETEEVYDEFKSETKSEEQYIPPVESKTTYSPEDLQTEAFFSHFDTKRTVDLLRNSEPEPVATPRPELEPEYKRVVQLEPAPKYVKKEPVKTEAERRAEIEKERAERRRRLWELTRGF